MDILDVLVCLGIQASLDSLACLAFLGIQGFQDYLATVDILEYLGSQDFLDSPHQLIQLRSMPQQIGDQYLMDSIL